MSQGKTIFICHNYKDESFASMSFHLANYLAEKGNTIVFISKDPYFESSEEKKMGEGKLILCSWPSRIKSTGLKDFIWFFRLWNRYRPYANIGHHNGSIVSNIILTVFGSSKIKTYDYHHINSKALIEANAKFTPRLKFFFFRKKLFYHLFCSQVICPSYESEKDLQCFFNFKKGVVIPNCIRDVPPNHNLSKDSKRTIFGFLGRLDRNKNSISLIEAFEKIFERHQDKELLLKIAGNGELKEQVMLRSENNSSIQWLGQLPYHEIDRFLSGIDWLVIPSFSDVLPTVGIEALANSKPLIFTHGCGLKDFLEEGKCFFLTKPDVNSLAEALSRSVLTSQDEYLEMTQKCRLAYEKNFSLPLYLKNMEKLLNSRKI